jgi:hypothetical protein
MKPLWDKAYSPLPALERYSGYYNYDPGSLWPEMWDLYAQNNFTSLVVMDLAPSTNHANQSESLAT